MPYVVTDACVKDFNCVDECAVSAIASSAGDSEAGNASQVFINPELCIDCGACAGICPSSAIFSEDAVPADKQDFIEQNRAYFG